MPLSDRDVAKFKAREKEQAEYASLLEQELAESQASAALFLHVLPRLVRPTPAPPRAGLVGGSQTRWDGRVWCLLDFLTLVGVRSEEHRLAAGHNAEPRGGERHAERRPGTVRGRALPRGGRGHLHEDLRLHLRLDHRHGGIAHPRLRGSNVRCGSSEEACVRHTGNQDGPHNWSKAGALTLE